MNPLDRFLADSGLAPVTLSRQWTALAGGVSSDIWRVDLADGRTLCVKRALPRLKVAADWQAPVSRNAYEWAWLRFAVQVLPASVPQPLAHDSAAGLFAMSFLPPDDHPVWKSQLLAGQVDVATAAAVGRTMGQLHGASFGRADLQAAFDSGANFHALRLEPYLLATATKHPALAARLQDLVAGTAARQMALVHGDVSPKNILVGPQGPVLLDAECAWYGDPAFDLAFCLNHLLLKALPCPHAAPALHAAFDALVAAYFAAASFSPRAALEARAAALLPALLLARVDGKSPVEYLRSEDQRLQVRQTAVPLIARPRTQLQDLARAWYASKGPAQPQRS